MNVQPVNLGDELREGVQPRLSVTPVIVAPPVANEFPHRRQLHALRVIGDRFLFGPAPGGDAATQVVEVLLRDGGLERTDCGSDRRGVGHGRLLAWCRRHWPLWSL